MKRYKLVTRNNGVYVAEDMTGPVNAVIHTVSKLNIPETDILSVTEVNENDEILYSVVKSNLTEEEIEQVMEPYQCVGSYHVGGYFKNSIPGYDGLKNTPLENIMCPVCGEPALFQTYYDDLGLGCGDYGVACDNCEFISPIKMSDCGESIVLFKEWLCIYTLLNFPKEYITKDLTLYTFPAGEWRDAIRADRVKDGWYLGFCGDFINAKDRK